MSDLFQPSNMREFLKITLTTGYDWYVTPDVFYSTSLVYLQCQNATAVTDYRNFMDVFVAGWTPNNSNPTSGTSWQVPSGKTLYVMYFFASQGGTFGYSDNDNSVAGLSTANVVANLVNPLYPAITGGALNPAFPWSWRIPALKYPFFSPVNTSINRTTLIGVLK